MRVNLTPFGEIIKTKSRPLLFALHGFMGTPADWDFLKEKVIEAGYDLVALDYTVMEGLRPADVPIENWGSAFHQWRRKNFGDQEYALVGYSQGGRLAMLALREQTEKALGAVIISASYGIPAQQQSDRLHRDQKWAFRFLNEDFYNVIEDWNNQDVFSGSKFHPIRVEDKYSIQTLAQCLQRWSVAGQPHLLNWLNQTSLPFLWMMGASDMKYHQLAQEIQFKNSLSQKQLISQSGHRVIFDHPSAVSESIKNFLSLLKPG